MRRDFPAVFACNGDLVLRGGIFARCIVYSWRIRFALWRDLSSVFACHWGLVYAVTEVSQRRFVFTRELLLRCAANSAGTFLRRRRQAARSGVGLAKRGRLRAERATCTRVRAAKPTGREPFRRAAASRNTRSATSAALRAHSGALARIIFPYPLFRNPAERPSCRSEPLPPPFLRHIAPRYS